MPRVPFVDRLGSHGGRPAILGPQGTLDHAELGRRVGQRRDELAGDRLLVLVEAVTTLDCLVTYLAALQAGHTVLLAAGHAPQACQELAERYDPDVVAGPAEGGWEIRRRRTTSRHRLHPELALLLGTSGSSGSPKLVRLSAANLQSNAEAVATSLGIDAPDRSITSLPISYCYGLSVVHSHLARGGSLVLTEDSVSDPRFAALARDHGVTTVAGVPYTFDLLERAGLDLLDLPSLRLVTQAGGRLAPERVRRYATLGRERGWSFAVMYGQTEATARMAVLPPELAQRRPGAVGLAVPGGSFRIDPVEDAADPTVGEVVYQGPNVMLGYAHGPADLARGRTVTELRTGDLGRIAPDGLLEITGRLGTRLKVRGTRLELDRLDAELAAAGFRCLSTGRDDLVVVLVERPDGGEAAVRRLVTTRFGVPPSAVRVAVVAAVPRLPNGKPDRAAARALLDAPGPDRPASDGDLLDRVRALYRELLDVEDVEDAASFVSLGGDSLSYVEMSLRLEDELGHLPAGWPALPVRALAELRHRARGLPAPRRGADDVPDADLGHRLVGQGSGSQGSGSQRSGIQGSGSRRWARVETSVVLRALAIVAIVGTHADLWTVRGGAHLLLAVAGFNAARLTFGAVGQRPWRRVRSAVARMAVPSMLWISVAALASPLVLGRTTYDLSTVLLLTHLFGPERWGPQWHFWFIESLIWALLAVAAALAVPWLRRLRARSRFGFAVALVGVGLLPRYDMVSVWEGPVLGTPLITFWLFALGWAAAEASRHWQRATVTALAALCVPGFFGNGPREAVVVGGLAVLGWLPTVTSPRLLTRPLGILAGSSLYIYLTQWVVYPLLDRVPLLATAAGLGVGILTWSLAERLRRAAVARPAPVTARRRAQSTGPSQDQRGTGRPSGTSSTLSGNRETCPVAQAK